jgi:hypothetical protein
MGDAFTFVIKGDASAFMMGDGMGDVHAFMIKGDTPLETRVSFTCIMEMCNRNVCLPFVREAGTSWILT